MKKKFTVRVHETYAKDYEIEAVDADEAREKAEAIASDDMDIATPNNFDERVCEVIDEEG